jgi:hypothetical protein
MLLVKTTLDCMRRILTTTSGCKLLLHLRHADCTAQPSANNTDYSCSLPASSGSSCNGQCNSGYEPGPAGPPRANCTHGRWSAVSCVKITATAPPPVVTHVTAQMTMTSAFSGSCSQQATDALANGLVADLQQTTAAMPNTTVAVKRGSCANSRRRTTTVSGRANFMYLNCVSLSASPKCYVSLPRLGSCQDRVREGLQAACCAVARKDCNSGRRIASKQMLST